MEGGTGFNPWSEEILQMPVVNIFICPGFFNNLQNLITSFLFCLFSFVVLDFKVQILDTKPYSIASLLFSILSNR